MKSWYKKFAVNINKETINQEPIPEIIELWLAELRLYHNIPLTYLVPDEKMLPPETLAFFQTDNYFSDALVNGALSVGRITNEDARNDISAMRGIRAGAMNSLHMPRMNKCHPKRRHLIKSTAGKSTSNETACVSGFLLRSEIVGFWRGIEVTGYANEQPLQILRMDKLNDEILLCLFNGICDMVTFVEPIEELRFGTNAADRVIQLRNVTEGKIGEPVKDYTLPIDANGRLRVAEMVDAITGDLGQIDSARFALQMLTVADSCRVADHPLNESLNEAVQEILTKEAADE